MAITTRVHQVSKKTKQKSTKASKDPKVARAAFAPPAPGRGQRGSSPLASSSSSTLSPNEKAETEAEVPYMNPAWTRWQCLLAKLENGQNAHLKGHRVIKSVQRRQHRDRLHSSESSSDSEKGNRPRVSFMDAEDTQPFFRIHERYGSVDIKYFKQIFFGTFRSKDLIKLGERYTKSTISRASPQPNGMLQLLRCFEIYGQAICYYAHSDIALSLQEALSDYRSRLIVLSHTYEFDSIRNYHYAVVAANMLGGQDNPNAWSKRDERCSELLVRKLNISEDIKQHQGSRD